MFPTPLHQRIPWIKDQPQLALNSLRRAKREKHTEEQNRLDMECLKRKRVDIAQVRSALEQGGFSPEEINALLTL